MALHILFSTSGAKIESTCLLNGDGKSAVLWISCLKELPKKAEFNRYMRFICKKKPMRENFDYRIPVMDTK